jgi:Tol biopolymer transport system component
MDADGSGVIQLTHDDSTYDVPTAWSPDGRQILFLSGRSGNSDLFCVRTPDERR